MRLALLVPLVAILSTGCVGKAKYDALYADYEKITEERKKSADRNKKLKQQLEECEEDKKRLRKKAAGTNR